MIQRSHPYDVFKQVIGIDSQPVVGPCRHDQTCLWHVGLSVRQKHVATVSGCVRTGLAFSDLHTYTKFIQCTCQKRVCQQSYECQVVQSSKTFSEVLNMSFTREKKRVVISRDKIYFLRKEGDNLLFICGIFKSGLYTIKEMGIGSSDNIVAFCCFDSCYLVIPAVF